MMRLNIRAIQTQIPTAPLWLGLAGVLPFFWGAMSAWNPAIALPIAEWLGPGFVGRSLQLTYGLWGFACKAPKQYEPLFFGLSVLPALWAAFFLASRAPMQLAALIGGFLVLFGLDVMFFRQGLTPDWWLKLRALLTTLVVICLALAA